MPTCTRCKKEAGGIGAFLSFNKQTGRCGNCEKQVRQSLDRFRQAFIQYCKDGIISDDEWRYLSDGIAQDNVSWNEAISSVRGDALHFLERTLTFADSDGIITDDEERYIGELKERLQVPPDLSKPIMERLAYLKNISRIRQGTLPTVQAKIHLESNEVCHLEIDATFHKVRASSIALVPGRIVVTNKKIHFLSESGGWVIAWKNVMRIDRDARSIYIELSTKKGNGRYAVIDPLMVEAILNTATRIAKRQLMVHQDEESRHIPQDVKLAVWQRDQGKCIQCSAISYLEFDHIIPFSKGGASTINNVQLLCRKCNLEKGDRI